MHCSVYTGHSAGQWGRIWGWISDSIPYVTHLVHLYVTNPDPVKEWSLYVNPIITSHRAVERPAQFLRGCESYL